MAAKAPENSAPKKIERRRSLFLVAAALAATVFFFSTDSTLAEWSTAQVRNSGNSAVAAQAVVLVESRGAAQCRSNRESTNESTCTTIDAYGGVTSAMYPGGSTTVDLAFTNEGSVRAQSFSLVPGPCTSTPAAATNLCTAADALLVSLACSSGNTFNAAAAWTDLSYAAGPPPTQPKRHTAVGSELGVNASWTCRLTLRLSATARTESQGVTVSQPLLWVLTR